MNGAIEMHKSNKPNVSSRNVRRKKNITSNFTWACFSDKILPDINWRGHLYIFEKNNIWFMSGVQAFAKIALFCDKYRENGQNPESGIDLRLVLKRYFHSGHQNVCGS